MQAVRWSREHWVELVVVSSSLLIADWLNVLVTLDRADLLVRLAQRALQSATGAGKAVWGALRSHRLRTLQQAAAATAVGRARAASAAGLLRSPT